jgi:hypothetical protein
MSSTDTTPRAASAEEKTPPAPSAECDVVMKGGITSGVVYPRALSELGKTYRLRGVGGASAGAIAAALGAAAEFGRASGSFARLAALPERLGTDGFLANLFQPQASTKPLLRLMLNATAGDPPDRAPSVPSKVVGYARTLCWAFPLASLAGVAPGIALVAYGATADGLPGALLIVSGLAAIPVGWSIVVALRLVRKMTIDVPGNLFGICRGLGTGPENPGLTDWLADQIDDLAHRPQGTGPLLFGHLWTGNAEMAAEAVAGVKASTKDRSIDLRMVSTCLSQGRPYELPMASRQFFYDPQTWSTLFPARVMAALAGAPPTPPTDEDAAAAAHSPSLRRLPEAEHLPVIVATRLSLSFPLLMSAVPLWTVDRRARGAKVAFAMNWFTDGGLSSNFPVHLFDATLPGRPTFDINLGPFSAGQQPSTNQDDNIEYARNNSEGILPTYVDIPERGVGAVAGFAGAAFNTARNWHDSAHLDLPGYRDRIVRIDEPEHGRADRRRPGRPGARRGCRHGAAVHAAAVSTAQSVRDGLGEPPVGSVPRAAVQPARVARVLRTGPTGARHRPVRPAELRAHCGRRQARGGPQRGARQGRRACRPRRRRGTGRAGCEPPSTRRDPPDPAVLGVADPTRGAGALSPELDRQLRSTGMHAAVAESGRFMRSTSPRHHAGRSDEGEP